MALYLGSDKKARVALSSIINSGGGLTLVATGDFEYEETTTSFYSPLGIELEESLYFVVIRLKSEPLSMAEYKYNGTICRNGTSPSWIANIDGVIAGDTFLQFELLHNDSFGGLKNIFRLEAHSHPSSTDIVPTLAPYLEASFELYKIERGSNQTSSDDVSIKKATFTDYNEFRTFAHNNSSKIFRVVIDVIGAGLYSLGVVSTNGLGDGAIKATNVTTEIERMGEADVLVVYMESLYIPSLGSSEKVIFTTPKIFGPLTTNFEDISAVLPANDLTLEIDESNFSELSNGISFYYFSE